MASARSRLSSGSDSTVDERKRKRMESNRESARRSLLKKQKTIDDLSAQVTHLQNENNQLVQRINERSHMVTEVEWNNYVLRAQLIELADHLASLNSVLQVIQETSGLTLDIPEIPDMIVKTWQLPCPAQKPVMTSFNPFQGRQ